MAYTQGDRRHSNSYHHDLPPPYPHPDSSIFDLSPFRRLAIGTGHFVNDITACIWFSYFILYIEEVAGLSPLVGGSLMLFGQVVDAISTPLVGFLADRQWGRLDTTGCGRLKMWHFFGVTLATVSFPFIFAPPFLGLVDLESQAYTAMYYIPFILVYEFSWAAVQISHLSTIPKATPDMYIRTEILSIRYCMMVVSNVFVFIVTWSTIGSQKHTKITISSSSSEDNCSIDQDSAPMFQHLALISMCVGLFTAVFFYTFSTEYKDFEVRDAAMQWERRMGEIDLRQRTRVTESHEEIQALISLPKSHKKPRFSSEHLNPGKDFMTPRDWLRTPQFYMVILIYIPGRLVINVPQSFLPLFLQHSLHMSCTSVAVIPLVYFSSGFFISTFMKMFAKTIGKQGSYAIGILLNCIGALLIEFLDISILTEYGTIYIIFAILGGGAAAGMITGLSITADMTGNNTESTAFVYGVMSFCDKMSSGIGIMVVSLWSPVMTSSEEILGAFYKKVLTWSYFGCSIIGAVGLLLITVFILLKTR